MREASGGRRGVGLVARQTFVIVGAGQAGAQAAQSLREAGFRGRIVLLGEEPRVPYMRPPLSKKFLAGETEAARLELRPAAAYEELDIELKAGCAVEGIDTTAARVSLANGLRLGYDKLLLATGSRAMGLDIPGARGPQVHGLRDLDDARRLRAALRPGHRIVVVGGGYLGLEVAATAAAAGARVTVLEREARVLARVASPAVSGFFARAHAAHGVQVRCGSNVLAFEGTDRLETVACDDGALPADAAVVAIGARPETTLAREAGIACDDGILVDASCRTSVENVFAAGDCTRHPDPMSGNRVRLESVQNAVDQAVAAAHAMCGSHAPYRKVPWFWTQQFDHRLQIAGSVRGHGIPAVRGDIERGCFALLHRDGGGLCGIEAVNLPAEFMAARRELARRYEGPPTAATAGERAA